MAPTLSLADQLRAKLQDELTKLGGDAYSDITITCGSDVHKVHKAHVCPKARFFARMFDGPFKEGSTGVAPLPADDPDAVVAMLYWMYTESYGWDIAEMTMSRLQGDPDLQSVDKTGFNWPHSYRYSDVCLDANVYKLAAKYDLPALKAEALSEFKHYARDSLLYKPQVYLEAVKAVYKESDEDDRGLRDIVVDEICACFKSIKSEALRELLDEVPELERELLLRLHDTARGK